MYVVTGTECSGDPEEKPLNPLGSGGLPRRAINCLKGGGHNTEAKKEGKGI